MDDHEAAATDIAGAWVGHRHGKAGGDRSIDGIPTALQHIGANSCGKSFLGYHQPMFGGDPDAGGGRWHIAAATGLLRTDRCSNQGNQNEEPAQASSFD